MGLAVMTMIALVVYIPLRYMREHLTGEGKALAVYFLGIGIGFMAIEIGLLQRFAIFFGHPFYALVVVLPGLLVASGLGSMVSDARLFSQVSTRVRIFALIALLTGTALLFPWFVSEGAAWETPIRIVSATVLLLPLGFLMGMPFAMGMRWASRGNDRLLPWLWGLNGVASVAASVLAVLCSLIGGIAFAFIFGIAGYVASWFAARHA